MKTSHQPNTALEPTAGSAFSFRYAGNAASRRWLSFCPLGIVAMRKFICILNLVAAVLAFVPSLPALVASPSLSGVFFVSMFAFWVFLAVLLLRSQKLLVWVGCLLFTLALVLFGFNQMLRVFSRIWRAEYGDQTVEIDPGSVGIPLIGSALFMTVALSLLVSLLTLPRWQSKREADA